MKILVTSFILILTICAVIGDDTVQECPKVKLQPLKMDNGKGCICYESSKYMVCSKIDQEWVEKFAPDKNYEIDTLVINDSPNHQLLSERFKNFDTPSGLKYKSLIFNLYVKSTTPSDSLDYLIAGATVSVEIKSSTQAELTIDASKFNKELTSLSLSNVKLDNFPTQISLSNLNKVRSLSLDNVNIGKNTLFVEMPTQLTRIEIINFPLLEEFKYVPKNELCLNQKIVLNLQNNPKLARFNMEGLFDDRKQCRYHIDLSGSGLGSDFFTKNQQFIKKADSPGQLYILLQNVKNLKCSKCILDWHKKFPYYMHSVWCKVKDGPQQKEVEKYIGDCNEAQLDACS